MGKWLIGGIGWEEAPVNRYGVLAFKSICSINLHPLFNLNTVKFVLIDAFQPIKVFIFTNKYVFTIELRCNAN